MACRYQAERASGAWWASPQGGPTLPTTATTSTTTGSPQVAPPTAGTVFPTSAAHPGPSIATAAGLGSTRPLTSSAGTQTAPAPTVDPAAFQIMERKMDCVLRRVSNLSRDVRYIERHVKSIKRTLRRANL
ncbi:hypothetical protein NDU88_004112 [Pleurodeles waltl]|uniref:Uncharacterized protein n=1 Tax=Pleurodeles waltl TaxID=8319 RepID=A0AAV7RG82_PLEWA|nr:hypothetical protein NDU88_004112 [Pleurodeles waltl]